MPSSKALLSSLSLAKVKEGDSGAHDVVASRARRVALLRDQSSHVTQQPQLQSSPYQRRLTAASSQFALPGKSLASPATNHSQPGGSHSVAGNSTYIKVPPLVLPRNDSSTFQDSPGSARLPKASSIPPLVPMRGALTYRGPPSNNHQTLSNHMQSNRGTAAAAGAQQQQGSSTARPLLQQQSSSHNQALDQQQDTGGQQQRSSSRSSSSTDASDSGGAWESGYITPAKALKRYSEYLTPFEQSEILDYHQVYFVGRSGAQKIAGSPQTTKANFGYDDERGDYTIVPHDHLAYRYEVLGVLGKGSFGQVVRVHDFKTNTLRAVKVIRNKKRFHHQALVELKVLQHIRASDPADEHHVVHMQDHFVFRNHLCISFELLSLNLYEFVKQNNFMGLSLGLIRRFAHQILITLKYLKELHIIHCDLKPENILLRQPNRSLVKVIDFGSSCFRNERVYTYIQSRFYRSPEVIMGVPYGCEIDIWSFGAILVELYTGYPLFPGEDEAEQLSCMMEVLGEPPADLLAQASRRKLFFEASGAPKQHTNSQGKIRHPGGRSLVSVLKGAEQEFLDFLKACLQWDPKHRITPDAALKHPWITGDLTAAAASAAPVAAPTPRSALQDARTLSSHRLVPLGSGSTALQEGSAGLTTLPAGLPQAAASLVASRSIGSKPSLQPLAKGGAAASSQLFNPTAVQQQGSQSQVQSQPDQGQPRMHLHAQNLGPAVKPLNLQGLMRQPLSPASATTPKAPLTPRHHRGLPEDSPTTQAQPLQPSAFGTTQPTSSNGLKRLRSSGKICNETGSAAGESASAAVGVSPGDSTSPGTPSKALPARLPSAVLSPAAAASSRGATGGGGGLLPSLSHHSSRQQDAS